MDELHSREIQGLLEEDEPTRADLWAERALPVETWKRNRPFETSSRSVTSSVEVIIMLRFRSVSTSPSLL